MDKLVTRRRLLQSAAALSAGAVAATAAGGAEEKAPAKSYFSGGELELLAPDAIGPKTFSTNISPDGLAMTVLFDSLLVSLGADDKGLSAVKVATLRIPFTLPEGKRLIGFTQDLRGYIAKPKGVRLALIADLGGSTEVFDFPNEQEATGEDFQRSFFSVDRREGAKGATTAYTVNLFLSVQRRTSQDQVQLALDSFDLEAILHNPETPKRKPTPKKVRTK